MSLASVPFRPVASQLAFSTPRFVNPLGWKAAFTAPPGNKITCSPNTTNDNGDNYDPMILVEEDTTESTAAVRADTRCADTKNSNATGEGPDFMMDEDEEDPPIHRTSAITAMIREGSENEGNKNGTRASEQAYTAISSSNPRTYSVSKKEREAFVAALPTKVQTMLNQPFGKENLTQCYKSEACLRLVLLPLWKSGFLDRACEWCAFASAFPQADCLQKMMTEYDTVDFRPLQGFQPKWETETKLNTDRVRWATAALLHFDGDMASLVRWIGGPHVGAHRNVNAILAYLQDKIEPDTWHEIDRLYRHGAPALANAEDSNANFETYRKYGNHKSYDENPEEVERTLVKDNARGYCLVFDPRLVDFVLNCHLTPGGLVNVDNPHKATRPIFDSSFRPLPGSMAINDHTNKRNEPPLHFARSLLTLLIWIYNMRVSYPDRDIYPGDDDIKGAFRHIKYHVNLIAWHCYMPLGLLAAATGMTFGDNTSPSNFEPIADGRRQLAQHLWTQPDTVDRAASFIPQLSFAPTPTEAEIAEFVQAEPDSMHQGVFEPDGARRPPPFPHHVDDNLYADVAEFMTRTVSASILALYEVLGFPTPEVPDPLSREKFDGTYTYKRNILGRSIDTRRMEVGITVEKMERAIATLHEWMQCQHYNIKDMATLHGTLEDMTRLISWARPLFYVFQNAIRRELHERYYSLRRHYDAKGKKDKLAKQLPAALAHRLESLIAIDKAAYLWSKRIQIDMTVTVRHAIGTILRYLTNPAIRWAQPIGYIIPRDPHCESTGDASELGAGAYSDKLHYWVNIIWSDKVKAGLQRKSTEQGFIHINSLEFVIALIQLAAAIVYFGSLTDAQCKQSFPNGRPKQPILLCFTDNTTAKSWANKLASATPRGQRLIGILAELLRTHVIGINANHIAGVDNVLADFISRPTHTNLSHAARAEQIFLKHEPARTWNFFQPSRKFLQVLTSSLFNGPAETLPALPKSLGRFVPAGSTIFSSPVI